MDEIFVQLDTSLVLFPLRDTADTLPSFFNTSTCESPTANFFASLTALKFAELPDTFTCPFTIANVTSSPA